MIKSIGLHTILRTLAIGYLADNNVVALRKLCVSNDMTPLELFARFVELNSVGEVGQMGG